MRGQISLDLILTLLVLGAFLQVLMVFSDQVAAGQAQASAYRQARALAADTARQLEAAEALGPGFSMEWKMAAKPAGCEVNAGSGRVKVKAGGAEAEWPTRARMALNARCGETVSVGEHG